MNRTRGSGGLYLRGNVWWIKYRGAGKVFCESSGRPTKNVAKLLLERRLAEVRTNQFVSPSSRRLTLSELYNGLIAEYKRRGKKTTAWVEARWKHRLEPFFGSVRASEVSTDLLNRYIDKQQADGLGDATINRDMAAIKRAFSLAYHCSPRKVQEMPCFPDRLTEPLPRKGFVDEAGYSALCKNAGHLWLRSLLALAYSFGLRKEEMLGMKVEQIDLPSRLIRLQETKNGEPRKIKMTGEVYTLIQQCIVGKAPADCVFTRASGKPVKSFRGEWDKLVIAAGLPELILHDLRRSAVRNMVRRSIPQQVAMAISGHKTPSVFARYNITSERDITAAADMIEAGRIEENEIARNAERLQLGDNRTTYTA
jgi:integrase